MSHSYIRFRLIKKINSVSICRKTSSKILPCKPVSLKYYFTCKNMNIYLLNFRKSGCPDFWRFWKSKIRTVWRKSFLMVVRYIILIINIPIGNSLNCKSCIHTLDGIQPTLRHVPPRVSPFSTQTVWNSDHGKIIKHEQYFQVHNKQGGSK